jgi:hypothetical protein
MLSRPPPSSAAVINSWQELSLLPVELSIDEIFSSGTISVSPSVHSNTWSPVLMSTR